MDFSESVSDLARQIPKTTIFQLPERFPLHSARAQSAPVALAMAELDELTPEAFDASRGFDDAELETCLKVLRALGGGGDADAKSQPAAAADGDGTGREQVTSGVHASFHHRRHKPLRVALQPLLAELRGQLGHYGVDPKAFRAAKQSKRDLNRRKMQEKALDRDAQNKTHMRAERLARLNALALEHEGVSLLANGTTDQIAMIETASLPPNTADSASRARRTEEENKNENEEGSGAVAPTRTSAPIPSVPDGCSGASAAFAGRDDARIDSTHPNDDGAEPPSVLHQPRQCYTCKRRYRTLHRFYGSLCPECAALNWAKRTQTANLAGRVVLVTGARVKIGYRIALKLLRCGAAVVATTRFPVDCARRFNLEPDAGEWRDRLTVVAMDLRDLPGLERLCARLAATLPRLDAIVNNACQTVRRPPAYYRHLLRAEAEGARARARGDDGSGDDVFDSMGTSALLAGVADASLADPVDPVDFKNPRASLDVDSRNRLETEFRDAAGATGWLSPSAAASQLAVLPSDAETSSFDAEASARLFPRGALDVNEQQIDLRVKTSWTSKLGEVETPELLEVLAVNAAAPFVLNGKLRALMAATATSLGAPAEADAADRARAPNRGFIVNVSAMEGKFYRYKTPNHPHTNMAKAALNMMTATSAADYKNDNVYMNAVDTGWINDENPRHVAARIAKEHEFQTPIDEEDAAARCVAPILEGVRDAAEPPFGKFFKDYRESEW